MLAAHRILVEPEHLPAQLLAALGEGLAVAATVVGATDLVVLATRTDLASALVDMAPTILELFGIDPPGEMVGGDLFSTRGE